MVKYSKHYGEFKNGVWVSYPVGIRKYKDTVLLKTQGTFATCPFCGDTMGGIRDTSTINVCRVCGTPSIVTKFMEIHKGSALYKQYMDDN